MFNGKHEKATEPPVSPNQSLTGYFDCIAATRAHHLHIPPAIHPAASDNLPFTGSWSLGRSPCAATPGTGLFSAPFSFALPATDLSLPSTALWYSALFSTNRAHHPCHPLLQHTPPHPILCFRLTHTSPSSSTPLPPPPFLTSVSQIFNR